MLWQAVQVADFRGEHWHVSDSTASKGFTSHRCRNCLHQFCLWHSIGWQKVRLLRKLYNKLTQIDHCLYIFRITLLIVLSISLRKYAIYDIYNNAFTHGGRLNVTLDRYFVVEASNGGHLTESRIQQKSKYVNRSNLSDITMRLGLVVSVLIPVRMVAI